MPKTPPPPDFSPTEPPDTVISHEALPPGSRVGGYQIVELLGDGAFGLVYLATDMSLQREVAIKEYLPVDLAVRRENFEIALRPSADAANFKTGMASFLNEARLLARFEHPAIPRVLSFWEENRTAYIAMPFYEGHSLATLLRNRRQPPDEAWVRGVIEPLLGALETLHAANCLQRDVTPGNVFIKPDGRPMLLDFSAAARAQDGSAQPFTALVDPAFAPLELYGETPSLPQGPWTDLYALAAVAYYAITGRLPMAATARAIGDTQPTLADSVKGLRASTHPNLQYSDALISAIDRALAVKPQARPQSAAEFKTLLDGAAAASPSTAPAPAATAPRRPPVEEQITDPDEKDEFGLTIIPDNWGNDAPPPAPPPRRRSAAPWIALLVLAIGGGVWWWSSPGQLERAASQTIVQQKTAPVAPAMAALPASASMPALPASAPGTALDSLDMAAATPARASSAVAVSPSASFASAPLLAGAPASAVTPVKTVVLGSRAPAPAQARAASAATPASAPAPALAPATRTALRESRPAPSAPPSVPTAQNISAIEAAPATPRQACAPRTQFSLFYCMQTQCRSQRFSAHPQCMELRRRGELD